MSVLGKVSVLTTLFAISWPLFVEADVLELKSGQKLEGQYAGGSKDEVRLQVGSQTLKFPISEVSRIAIGTAGQEDFYKAAKEALRQLKALTSVTEGGTIYRNYSTRVEDVKIKVDQFLDEYKPSPLPKFNQQIADSLGFYVVASSVWNAKQLGISANAIEAGFPILQNEYVSKCPPLQVAMARSLEKTRKDPRRTTSDQWVNSATLVFDGLPLLWECARNSLIDAEKALAR